jgi:virulence-associated protein VagC
VTAPQGERRHDLLLNGPRVSQDFVVEREQPTMEESCSDIAFH